MLGLGKVHYQFLAHLLTVGGIYFHSSLNAQFKQLSMEYGLLLHLTQPYWCLDQQQNYSYITKGNMDISE